MLHLNFIFNNQVMGKLLFVLFDLLCGYLIVKIIQLDQTSSSAKASSNTTRELSSTAAALAFWFYNPITLAISSRGNAESIIAFLVLIFVYNLKRGNFILAGLFYGLSIHFKIYPITYALAILFHLANPSLVRSEDKTSSKSIFNLIRNNRNLLEFGLASVGALASLTVYFYFR